jgi:hypothetical protein
MKISLLPLLAGSMAISAIGNVRPAHGQPQHPAPAPRALTQTEAYELPVKNVAPHIVAWWLDSAHQARPVEIGPPEPNEEKPGKPVFELPSGVDKIVPIDSKMTLLVVGTEKGARELRETVAFLDRPLRFVEIEARIVQMRPQDIKDLDLDFGDAFKTRPQGQIGVVPAVANVHRDVSALLAKRGMAGQLADIDLTPVKVTNNTSASLENTRSYPAPAALQNQLATVAPQTGEESALEVQASLKISLVPTINNDDTVTMLLNLDGQVHLGRKNGAGSLPLGKPSPSLNVISTIKDGETIAIQNPTRVPLLEDLPIISELFRSKKADELIVFLTPRIVRTQKP